MEIPYSNWDFQLNYRIFTNPERIRIPHSQTVVQIMHYLIQTMNPIFFCNVFINLLCFDPIVLASIVYFSADCMYKINHNFQTIVIMKRFDQKDTTYITNCNLKKRNKYMKK